MVKKKTVQPDEDKEKIATRTLKDPSAPVKPLSAFNLFKKEHLEVGGSKSSSVREWRAATTEERAPYLKQAREMREQYSQELKVYRQSQSYKDFMKAKRSAKEIGKAKRGKKRKSETDCKLAEEEVEETALPPHAVPVFTESFLRHNKDRERALRALRKRVATAEEEAALLAKHVEATNSAADRLREEVDSRSAANEALEEHLSVLRDSVREMLNKLPPAPPGLPSAPLPESQEDLLSGLTHLHRQLRAGTHPAFLRQVRQVLKSWDPESGAGC